MRTHTSSLLGVCLAALVLATGCDDSTHPLSDPATSTADQRLEGIWQQKNQNSTTYYHVGLLGGNAPSSVMRVVLVTHEETGQLQKPEQALLFPTEIGGEHYLNVAPAEHGEIAKVQEDGWKTDLLDSYFLLKYRMEGDRLLVWSMSGEKKDRAIEAGKIQGQTKSEERVTKFTDTTENVAEFVAASGDDLFAAEALSFERVR